MSSDNPDQDEVGEVGNGMDISESGTETTVAEICCGTDMTMEYIQCMEAELQTLRSENLNLKQRLSNLTFSENFLKKNDSDGSVTLDDDEKVKYYTGLPTLLTLTALLNFLSPFISSGPRTVTTKFQDLSMVLMRLRLNLPVRVIADWFQVSSSGVSRNFF